MYEEPEGDEPRAELAKDPKSRAEEKSQELRMFAELAALFEGTRKFDAAVNAEMGAEMAREVQRGVARLEKSKGQETLLLPPAMSGEARGLLTYAEAKGLSTNDYHVYRRPGETMVMRWLAGEEVEKFHGRMQAHYDAMMEGQVEDERQQHGWRADAGAKAYLEALEGLRVDMAEKYNRQAIRAHRIFTLRTLAADEMNLHLITEQFMGISAAELVGEASASEEEFGKEGDPWFFKMYVVLGIVENVERLCLFTYMQKASDDEW